MIGMQYHSTIACQPVGVMLPHSEQNTAQDVGAVCLLVSDQFAILRSRRGLIALPVAQAANQNGQQCRHVRHSSQD